MVGWGGYTRPIVVGCADRAGPVPTGMGMGAGAGTGMTVVAVWVLYPANCGGGIVSGELWWGLRTGQALSLRVRVAGAGAGMTVVAVWVLYPAIRGGG